MILIMKKLLVCILISMLITSFIGLEINKIYTKHLIEDIPNIPDENEAYEEYSKYVGEQFKNFATNWQEGEDEEFDKTLDEVNTKYIGLACITYEYINSLNIYGLYYMLLVFGAVIGVMVYFIFVRQFKISKLFLPFIACLGVLEALYYFIMLNSYGFAVDELLQCLALYIVIVILCYIINFCLQKKFSYKDKEDKA